LQQFRDVIAVAGLEVLSQNTELLAMVLCGIDDAFQSPAEFRAFCDRLRAEHSELESCRLVNWYLLPAEPRNDFGKLSSGFGGEQERFASLQSGIDSEDWLWQDPFDDCSFALQDGLEIRAANGRDLWHINLSAPRPLRPALGEGDWAVATVCGPAVADRPAIGGLLLWQDEENYLRLDRGTRGPCEISFQGCIGNQDVVIGRGRLAAGDSGTREVGNAKVWLRLERVGERVRALCSADGEEWFSVGAVDFLVAGPLHVGLHAIGMIDRTIYHGAYPDGTAIRFAEFRLWGR
jgi:hypothetical protein